MEENTDVKEVKQESKFGAVARKVLVTFLIIIGLLVIVIGALALVAQSIWEFLIPDIFVTDSLIKYQIDLFPAVKLVLFISIFTLTIYSFQLIRNIVRVLKTPGIVKFVIFLLLICFGSMILGSITYLMWGWLVPDLIGNSAQSVITNQIGMKTSVVISLMILLVIASDDILNAFVGFIGGKKR